MFLDDGINQNIGDNDSHILNINETVVIEAEDNITPTKDGIISAGNHSKLYSIYIFILNPIIPTSCYC